MADDLSMFGIAPTPTATVLPTPTPAEDLSMFGVAAPVHTPAEVDAMISATPVVKAAPVIPQAATQLTPAPMSNEDRAALEAVNEVQSNEAGKNFDYSQSPLRHIFSEDTARQLVGSQWKSNNRDLAFNSAQQNAILLGAGNWLDREIHGDSTPSGLRKDLPSNTASDPDYAAAARAEHPIAAHLGNVVGMAQGLAGEVPAAVAMGTKSLIRYIAPAVKWVGTKLATSAKLAAGGAAGAAGYSAYKKATNGDEKGALDEE